jgi:hypothetical protein
MDDINAINLDVGFTTRRIAAWCYWQRHVFLGDVDEVEIGTGSLATRMLQRIGVPYDVPYSTD